MRFFQITSLLALLLNLLLGGTVFSLNPRRAANRMFLATSFLIGLWLLTQFIGARTRDPVMLLFWIRQASIAATFIPPAFDFMRLSIHYPDLPRRRVWSTLAPWLLLVAGMVLLCNSAYFVYDIAPSQTGFVHPVYGPGHYFYLAYWISALILLVWRYSHSLRNTRGIAHTELGFILLASTSALVVGVTLNHAIPAILSKQLDIVQIMPFLTSLLIMGTIAYGIATRRIMSVTSVVQRAVAYIMLTTYLSLLYLAVYYGARFVLARLALPVSPTAALLAALTVAFSMAPAQGYMQYFAKKIFLHTETMDIPAIMRRAHQTALSLGTSSELIARFARIFFESTGSSCLFVLQPGARGFATVHALPDHSTGPVLPEDSALVRLLERREQPLSIDLLRRMRPTPELEQAGMEMRASGVSVALGLRTTGRLQGLILLGRRLTGHIFSADELGALHMLGGHLSVALDNARLYTQVQNARIYNEILLNALNSGIIAIDVEGAITVFNREASRILGFSEEDMIGRNRACLPAPIQERLSATLVSGSGLLDETLTLERPAGADLPLRVSSSLFHSHTGEKLGALLIFQDISLIRQLEEQVRRTDRLSSLGTLSAGMAHEIKNPLVTIKTFTQLLPERYTDPEFRETFSGLVGREVERIDAIVNRLLHFARPAPAVLRPIALHEVVERSTQLMEQPLRSGSIRLQTTLRATRDRIQGDHDLLIQALINFYLNALQAMPGQGTLEIATRDEAADAHPQDGAEARLCLSIRDTGSGIEDEDLPKIFDPFFSRSANGTGLGLSIAHGIIQEHKGSIAVESQRGQGTVFRIFFPLLEEHAE